MQRLLLVLLTPLMLGLTLPANGQRPSSSGIELSGDIAVAITPIAALITTLALKDYKGLKQGALTGVVAVGTAMALKYIIEKPRPDGSDTHSFPSAHTATAFAGAAFIQRRYGWSWGIPSYILASYVAFTRIYANKHDGWDVAAGAILGVGSAYIFTKPFFTKHKMTLSPIIGDGTYGLYGSITF